MTARARRGARLATSIATVVVSGCGDSSPVDDVVTAVSGDRLKTMWLGYDGGTRQLHTEQVHDLVEHATCAPRRWTDGVLRCMPAAENAVYVDRDCTRAVGRSLAIDPPSHFVLHERIEGVLVPMRVLRAGAVVAPIATFFERRDGVCVGPLTAGEEHITHAITGEVDVRSLPALAEEELGAGRLGLVLLTSADGLRLPTGVRDRELGVACTPARQADGSVRCEPDGAVLADWFTDASCRDPALRVLATEPAPMLAYTVDGAGCSRYLRVGAERATIYGLFDGQCVPRQAEPDWTAYATDGEVPLVELARTLEPTPGRRLQPIVLASGDLRFHDALMHDTAIAEDCRPTAAGAVTRCVPEVLALAMTRYTSASCQVAVPVVELPQPTCRSARFARTSTGSSLGELRLIGDPVPERLYDAVGVGFCTPYFVPAGRFAHGLGPPLDPTLFVGAILFGER